MHSIAKLGWGLLAWSGLALAAAGCGGVPDDGATADDSASALEDVNESAAPLWAGRRTTVVRGGGAYRYGPAYGRRYTTGYSTGYRSGYRTGYPYVGGYVIGW
jgi:hypothetical protein